MRKTAALIFLLAGLALCAYVVRQDPKVWCNRQWAGLALCRGGYRSWTVRYSQGEDLVTGKNYWCAPTFSHVDIRGMFPCITDVSEVLTNQ